MQRCAKINPTEDSHRDSQLCVQVAAVKRSLETKVLPKHHPPESILQPINRLPADVFVLIPHFFTREVERQQFAPPPPTKLNKPLITITHVCRSRGGACDSPPRAFGPRSTSPCLQNLNWQKFSSVDRGTNSSASTKTSLSRTT